MAEDKSKTSVGHALPEDMQKLREDKAPEEKAKGYTKGKFTYAPGLANKKEPQPTDNRIVVGGHVGESRPVPGPRQAANFQVDMSTVKPDKTTSDRIVSLWPNNDDGFAINVYQKVDDGTHRLVLFIVGSVDETGEVLVEVRSKNDENRLPMYQVKTNPKAKGSE